MTIKRPRHFFDPDGDLPETVTLRFLIPDALGDPAELRRRVAEVEALHAKRRARTGARVLGCRAFLRRG